MYLLEEGQMDGQINFAFFFFFLNAPVKSMLQALPNVKSRIECKIKEVTKMPPIWWGGPDRTVL